MRSTDAMWKDMRWSHENGSYLLRNDDGIVILRTKEPTILFNVRTGQMIRCGDRERVMKLAAKMRADLIKVGDVNGAKDLILITSARFSVTELNLCTGEPGYCRALHKRFSTQ